MLIMKKSSFLRENKEFAIINLFNPIERVVDSILACENTFSSSLHGIIVSYAYNIPSLRFVFSKNNLGDLKFHDYFLSVNLKKYNPIFFGEKVPENNELIKTIKRKKDIAIPDREKIKKYSKT